MRPGIYQHVRGAFYQVMGVAKTNQKKVVVYQALYGDFDIRVEDIETFKEKVKIGEPEIYSPKFKFFKDNFD